MGVIESVELIHVVRVESVIEKVLEVLNGFVKLFEGMGIVIKVGFDSGKEFIQLVKFLVERALVVVELTL